MYDSELELGATSDLLPLQIVEIKTIELCETEIISPLFSIQLRIINNFRDDSVKKFWELKWLSWSIEEQA